MASKTKDRIVMQITMFRIRFHLTVASLVDFQVFPMFSQPELVVVDRRGIFRRISGDSYVRVACAKTLKTLGTKASAQAPIVVGNHGKSSQQRWYPLVNSDLMGFYGDLMIFDGDLMGFYGDLMGCLSWFSGIWWWFNGILWWFNGIL